MASSEPAKLAFAKLHGAGNAYLAVDARQGGLDLSELARAMGSHHTGVGSDGLVAVLPAEDPAAAIRVRIFNTDGSEAEMSGNGVRLFAKFVLDRELARCGDEGGLVVQTLAGLRTVWPRMENGVMAAGRVGLDVPSLLPSELPMLCEPERWVDRPLEGIQWPEGTAPEPGADEIRVTCLSVGNPHAVHFTDAQLSDFPLEAIGEQVQNHPRFPNRVNFEVVRRISPSRFSARIYERGEGETPSSGTGSTACAVAARLLGYTDAEVAVELPGGVLEIAWEGEGKPAWLDGPTVEIFSGWWSES